MVTVSTNGVVAADGPIRMNRNTDLSLGLEKLIKADWVNDWNNLPITAKSSYVNEDLNMAVFCITGNDPEGNLTIEYRRLVMICNDRKVFVVEIIGAGLFAQHRVETVMKSIKLATFPNYFREPTPVPTPTPDTVAGREAVDSVMERIRATPTPSPWYQYESHHAGVLGICIISLIVSFIHWLRTY
jgi:hypothetical protein